MTAGVDERTGPSEGLPVEPRVPVERQGQSKSLCDRAYSIRTGSNPPPSRCRTGHRHPVAQGFRASSGPAESPPPRPMRPLSSGGLKPQESCRPPLTPQVRFLPSPDSPRRVPTDLRADVAIGSQLASAEVGVLVLAEVLPPFERANQALPLPTGPVPSETQLNAVVAGVPSNQARRLDWHLDTDGGSRRRETYKRSLHPVASRNSAEPGIYTRSVTRPPTTVPPHLPNCPCWPRGTPPDKASVRIRAGGGSYKDSLGNQWSGDTLFSGGGFFSVTTPVKGTPDPTLYQSERYGSFSYRIPLRNGLYTLRLHFAELWHKRPCREGVQRER
jgi:hypothetical protein